MGNWVTGNEGEGGRYKALDQRNLFISRDFWKGELFEKKGVLSNTTLLKKNEYL